MASRPAAARELSLYCIDIYTITYGGIGYVLGTWNAANVPNVDYVARLLNEYYPNTDEPAALTDLNQKAAAVQAAIWFFTDRYVLNTSDPLHDAVAAIVDDIRAEGPLVQPPPPSLTITPSHVSGPAGSVLGPFTVNTDATPERPPRHRHRHGREHVLGLGRHGADRQWSLGAVRPEDLGAVDGSVHRGARGHRGGDRPHRQRLPLRRQHRRGQRRPAPHPGQDGHLENHRPSHRGVSAPGSLVVKKTIAGPAAGSQARVVIHTVCDGVALTPDFVIPAGTPAGDKSKTYKPIPAGSLCTVTETSDGSVVGTDVVVIGAGQEATIPAGESETVHITDTYHFVGSLLVRKTIAGPGAGQQGEIRIHTVCDGKALTPDFVIPAGTPAGDQTKQYDQIESSGEVHGHGNR